MCESGSLYWANWPKTWFTQFPNHNHWISESFCVRRGVSGFRALCKPPSKLSQLSLLTNLCGWYAVDRKFTDVVIWNTTKTGSVSKRALLTFYVLCSLGRLSSNVFERRMSSGSEPFSFSICLNATKFVLLGVFTLIETICRSWGYVLNVPDRYWDWDLEQFSIECWK